MIRERWPEVGILVLSQFARPSDAFELLQTGTEGIGYILKDRVSDLETLADGVRRVAAGGRYSTRPSSGNSSGARDAGAIRSRS